MDIVAGKAIHNLALHYRSGPFSFSSLMVLFSLYLHMQMPTRAPCPALHAVPGQNVLSNACALYSYTVLAE